MTKNQKASITPYANESEVMNIGGITVENRTDRITIHGDTDITMDKEGLEKALDLKRIIDDTLSVLQSKQLPDKIEVAKPATVHNPFSAKK